MTTFEPELQPQTVDELLAEIEASPFVELTTQEELLTAIDELLDNALHGDGCFIDPDDTTCVCVIGQLRAALPPCEETKTFAASGWDPVTVWKCRRNAHPASPDRHEFGAV